MTNTATSTFTNTNTLTSTETSTPTEETPINTLTSTMTNTATSTFTNTNILTSTETSTPTETLTNVVTDTVTNTVTITHTPINTKLSVIPLFHCVFDNLDDTYSAYFGYENPNGEEIAIKPCVNEEGEKNLINDSDYYCEQEGIFEPGLVNGAFYIPFNSKQSVTWTLQNKISDIKKVSVTSMSTKCAKITPYMQCIDKNSDGTYKAHFGYKNENDFELQIPQSVVNFLSTGDKMLVENFFPGKVDNAFSVDFSDKITWFLNNNSATADANSPYCGEKGCTKVSWKENKLYLNGDEFESLLNEQTEALLKEKNPFPAIRNIRSSVKRRIKRVNKENQLIKSLGYKLPDYFLSCDDDTLCPMKDNKVLVDVIDRKLRKLRRQVGRTIRQRNNTKNKRTMLLNKNSKILQEKLLMISKIPRFVNDCNE